MMMLPVESEADLRSCYCAAAITYILTKGRKVGVENIGYDEKQLVNYVESCRTFGGGYGDAFNFESHAGLTYCAVAQLKLLGQKRIEHPERVIEFCVSRQ